mgnify:CR=1 FL=1
MNAASLLPDGLLFFERGWLSSNNVLLMDERQGCLIDTGYWTHAPQTVALVEGALGERSLTRILNTHLHSDHCGGNAALQARYPSVHTAVPPGHACHVFDWDPAALTYTPTGQHCPPFRADDVIRPGDVLEFGHMLWEVHAAPGHDPHSVIFYCPEHGVLISADSLWENGFGVVFPELEGVSAFDEVADTLTVIERLNPRVVLPGHGAPFTDVSGALQRARQRLMDFRQSPAKHAQYAAKVLLKFKLLELQRVACAQFLQWAADSSYLQTIHGRWGMSRPIHTWLGELIQQLEKSQVARMEGEYLVNI